MHRGACAPVLIVLAWGQNICATPAIPSIAKKGGSMPARKEPPLELLSRDELLAYCQQLRASCSFWQWLFGATLLAAIIGGPIVSTILRRGIC